ncbi:MAG TPA: hypothetical protein PKC10_06295 [Cyclobacteriaceae bacterium]|nr:hypothetical protein [Cyclobacteriaceae bacterium]
MILLLLAVFVQCDNTPDFDKGPCKFAPPESNFPLTPGTFCEECYFNFEFQDREYSFTGNKLESSYVGDYSKMWNVFFDFYLDLPDSDEELNGSIDVKTPLVEIESITKSIETPPVVSTAFGIYNYCKDLFEPVPYDINQSFNRLIKAELIESYPAEINSEPHQSFLYYLNGELQATFNLNGETEVITAEYKVRCVVYEKL